MTNSLPKPGELWKAITDSSTYWTIEKDQWGIRHFMPIGSILFITDTKNKDIYFLLGEKHYRSSIYEFLDKRYKKL